MEIFPDFPLDVFGQQTRINQLYTNITLYFSLEHGSDDLVARVKTSLRKGVENLSLAFPWIAGQVVNENGTFTIKPLEKIFNLTFKHLEKDFPGWSILQQAQFPFRFLDESVISAYGTLAEPINGKSGRRVFAIQANFIFGGILLTFSGQHGSMDMAGLVQMISLFAKGCRGEQFTSSELSIGNMNRKNLIPLLDKLDLKSSLDRPKKQESQSQVQQAEISKEPPKCIWAYFSFPLSSLQLLKSNATKSVPSNSFVSTDDTLSAFVWQSITQARHSRLSSPSSQQTKLSRNVDVRSHFSLPQTYPGLIFDTVHNAYTVDDLLSKPLGTIALALRSSLDRTSVSYHARALATAITQHGEAAREVLPAPKGNPELDVRLSSWMKENLHGLDFGAELGTAKAVRRPRFEEGAREELVYFLPRGLDGEVVVAICLREEDMERLKVDGRFLEYCSYIG
jgi:trichothecene 3-O-acetyltransferase